MRLDGMTYGLMMVAIGAGTFLIRFSFIWLFGRGQVRPEVQRLLRFVPPAVLSALALPAFVYAPAAEFSFVSPRFLAGLVAAGVAAKSRSVLLTILSGMTTLWALTFLKTL